MTGKGLARLCLLVATALIGAGLTLGAMHTPLFAALDVEQAEAQTGR